MTPGRDYVSEARKLWRERREAKHRDLAVLAPAKSTSGLRTNLVEGLTLTNVLPVRSSQSHSSEIVQHPRTTFVDRFHDTNFDSCLSIFMVQPSDTTCLVLAWTDLGLWVKINK